MGPQGTFEIRAYQDSDEAGVVSLWQLCFPDDPGHNSAQAFIARKRGVQPELFLVLVHDGDVLGTAVGGYDGHRGWVYHVATHPQHRRQGHGRELMRAIERALERMGCPKLNLQVRSGNPNAVRFYEALGYRIEERVSLGKVLGVSS